MNAEPGTRPGSRAGPGEMLFAAGGLSARIAGRDDHSALHAFAVANPGYDILLTGAPPDPDAWVEDFLTDLPPAAFGWSATHKIIAAPDTGGPIAAVMDISLDMLAPGVGHIGLFQIAEARHGSGLAQALYEGLERWMAAQGSDCIRLGVLHANPRGRAFWDRQGYLVSRTRLSPPDAPVAHVADVMVKFLRAPMAMADWWARVPRDRPEVAS